MIHLYVKIHTKTNLKYFGKTTVDPYKYLGSGKRWKNHIKAHGKEHVKTLKVWSFLDLQEAKEFAIKFSNDNQIVTTKGWANLIIENATDGLPPGLKGEKAPFYGKTHSSENKQLFAELGKQRKPIYAIGTEFSEDHKAKLSASKKGKPPNNLGKAMSDSAKEAIRQSVKGRKRVYREDGSYFMQK